MALTLKDRIELYSTATVSADEASSYLKDGVHFISDVLPKDILLKQSTKTAVDVNGKVDITDSRVLDVISSTGIIRKIPNHLSYQVQSSASLHYATSDTPVYWVEDGYIYTYPIAGGYVYLYKYTTPDGPETDISNFPSQATEGVIVYASIEALLNSIKTDISKIQDLTLTLPTAPTAPTISDVSASTFTYIDIASTSIVVRTPPTYTKPATTVDFSDTETYIATDEDLEKASVELNNQTERIKDFQMSMYNELNEFNASIQGYIEETKIDIENARLAQEKLMSDKKLGQELTEFQERNRVEVAFKNYEIALQKYIGQVQSYQAEVTAKVNGYASKINNGNTTLQARIPILNGLSTKLKELVEVYRGLS